MDEFWLIIPVSLAVGIGWWLGRRERLRQPPSYARSFSDDYFDGLNLLLDDKTDQAIESFTRAVKDNSDSIPIYLALARLLRRRGDVQRSIRLHQELLARPMLSRKEQNQIQLALGKDYMKAGLYDRAEQLLKDLVDRTDKHQRQAVLRLLTNLYQTEKEWSQALSCARQLDPSDEPRLEQMLAHICCEEADQQRKSSNLKEARSLAKQALDHDPACVRASFLLADLDCDEGNWKSAIRYLRQVGEQDASFLLVSIPKLADLAIKTDTLVEFKGYLENLMLEASSTTAMIHLAEIIREDKGDYHAATYIIEQLKRRPSVRGFNRLIDLQMKYAGEGARESLQVLRGLTGPLEQTKPIYRCGNCGFSGRSLHWQCPSCKSWGVVKPIQGLEGD